jgi:cytochrome b561
MSETSQEITKSDFSLTAKIFHWSFVILFAYGISKQIEDLALLKFEIAFAFLFFLFLVVRFFYMTRTQKSSLPRNTPKIQKIAAKSVHYGMYIGMASIALSGLVIGFLYWLGLKSGIIIDIIIGWHETSVSIVYWLIGIHLLGAIYHRIKNDGVWNSMVPIFKN